MKPDLELEIPEHSRVAGFRRTVLRGFGVILPPLLTIVVLIWAWTTIETYVLRPVEGLIQSGVVLAIQDSPSQPPRGAMATADGFIFEGTSYVPDPTGRRYIPDYVKKTVDENVDAFAATAPPAASANAYWQRYVQLVYMPRSIVVPV